MTSNLETRQQFKKQLQDEYSLKGIESMMCLEFFKHYFCLGTKDRRRLESFRKQVVSLNLSSHNL